MNIFEKAIERIRGRWDQGALGEILSDTGPVCALGALKWAYNQQLPHKIDYDGLMLYSTPPEAFLGRYMRQQEEYRDWDDIPQFNDDPCTSEEDVILLLKKAAQEWEEEKEHWIVN